MAEKKEETKKIDKKNLEELAKLLKTPQKKEEKKPEKKEETDEEEIEEDNDEEFFIEPETGFIRQTRHGILNSGLVRANPSITNLEKSLEDVSISPTKKDEDFYTAAKYGNSNNGEDNKYASQNPQVINEPLQRLSINGASKGRNEFIGQMNQQTINPLQDPKKVEYNLPENRLNQDELQFGRKDNEHIRKYK